MIDYCRKSTARGESHDFQYRMITADDRIIWLRDIVTVISEAGQPQMLRGVTIDVTRQREIEHQLRSNDQHLQLMTSQMSSVFWSVDRELRFTSSLGAGLQRLGVKPNEVIGMTLDQYFHDDPAEADRSRRYHQSALEGNTVNFRSEWKGSVYECRIEPLRDESGEITCAIGLALDVTEGERAEQKLRESEARWQSIFEFAVDPIWEWDIANDRTILSPSWARLLGYDPDAFDPEQITWESVLHPDDRERVLTILQRYLSGEIPEYVAEYRIRTRTGEWRRVIGRGVVAARDENRRPLRMVGCVVDVTASRNLEQKLRNRIAGESLLTSISSDFVNIASDRLDEAIDNALQQVGKFAGADRAYLFLLSEDGKTLSNTNEWCAEGIEPRQDALQDIPVDEIPWWMNHLRDFKAINISDVDEMPDSAGRERELLNSHSIRSLLAVPMHFLGQLRGFLGYDRVRELHNEQAKTWSEEDASMLGAMGNVFISAIERRRVEQSIVEKERFLSTLLSNLPGWVYRCRNDREWTYEYSSDGIVDVLGFSSEAFTKDGGLAFNDLIHPDDREYVWRAVQEAVDTDHLFQLTYRVRAADGTERWVWEQGQAIKGADGRVLCIEGFVSDVTERKRAEDELRRQEREFHAIVRNTPDIISRFDRELRHVYVNPVVEHMTGHAPQSLLNKHVDELDWPKDVRDRLRGAIKVVMEQRREKVIEFDLNGPHGRIFLESRLVPEFDDEGHVESVLSIARNVTMRKRAELGLMRENETQRLLLRELDHRVRNNLASLAALIDITGRNATSITEFADSIRGRVQAMTAVHGLLSKGHWTSVSLHDLLESLIPADLFGRFELRGPNVRVRANQCTALGMVVQELVANSLKYGALHSADGTVQIHWTCEELDESPIALLCLGWNECGGPAITDINRPGLGTNLIQGLVRTELRGTVSLTYPATGARHTFQLELERDEADV